MWQEEDMNNQKLKRKNNPQRAINTQHHNLGLILEAIHNLKHLNHNAEKQYGGNGS